MLIDPKQWPILSKLLDEVLDVPPEDRDRWLESLPPETVAYKDELRSLLRHAGTAETRDFLDVLPNLYEAVAEVRAATHVAMLTPGSSRTTDDSSAHRSTAARVCAPLSQAATQPGCARQIVQLARWTTDCANPAAVAGDLYTR
jgi:hypothetical protein